MSKSEYFRNQFELKKNKYRQTFEIVTGRIEQITNNKLKVKLPKNKIGECSINNISDFGINNLNTKFQVGQYIDVAIIGKTHNGTCILNYKMVHPKEIKFKVKAIPTASHYRTLSKQLTKWIDDELLIQQKCNVVRKRGVGYKKVSNNRIKQN